MWNVKRSKAQKIGEKGESLLEFYLSEFGSVNKFHKDFGIDFICSLVSENDEYTGATFLAQCKGTEKVSEDKDNIGIQVSTSTVRLWFKQRNITFLFYVDTENRKIYWVDPFNQLSEKIEIISDNQKKISLKIPKKNLLDGKKLSESFYTSIDNFDSKLFGGELIEINKNIDVFSEADYFSDKLVINEHEEVININCRNVKLIGFFLNPEDYRSYGNCLIQIVRHVKKAENDLTFTHQQLLELFYFGKKTSVDLGMRKFVKGYLKEYGQYFVDLGNSRVYLYPEELEDLCKVVDAFIERYVLKITSFLKQIGSYQFKPYKQNIREYHLLQVDISVWENIVDYVQEHQVDFGKYEDGYVFTNLSNVNEIGLNDKEGYQLLDIQGKYVQSEFDSKKVVVDVVWVFLDENNYYRVSNNAYSIYEAYVFFVEKLMAKFLYKTETILEKKMFFLRKKNIELPVNKQDIDEFYFRKGYKIDITSINSHHEMSTFFLKLEEFVKRKKYFSINSRILIEVFNYLNKKIDNTLSNYNDYQKSWYKREKEDAKKEINKIETNKNGQEEVSGYIYAAIFRYCFSSLIDFEDSFNDDEPYFKELIQGFSSVVEIYNEERLIELLLD
ncbi:DUF4365 domain-containing protein [Enterococcus faecalis]|uniref:DUF4365 domain-containing protein n=4 Tax=Enterococcus TaxID=1350 RepID=UPI00163CEBB1|nr:DUF4365 domain-containing protein [Enterococcus faecalis]